MVNFMKFIAGHEAGYSSSQTTRLFKMDSL